MKNSHTQDILIIEDSEAAAKLLGIFLKELGYQKIHNCVSGTLGIQKFQELAESHNVPFVFLDYHLPDIDALKVLKQILKIHPDTEVIVETIEHQNQSGIKKLFKLGARYYFPKPYKFDKLREIMNTLEPEAAPLAD